MPESAALRTRLEDLSAGRIGHAGHGAIKKFDLASSGGYPLHHAAGDACLRFALR